MERYGEKIKKRIWLHALLAVAALAIAAVGVVRVVRGDLEGFLPAYIQGMLVGMFAAFFGGLVLQIVRYIRALHSADKLRALYIDENDERTRLIDEKTGGMGMNLLIAALVLGVLLSSYLNLTVAATLAGVLLFAAMLRFGLWLYYTCKLSGDEQQNRYRKRYFAFLLGGLVLILAETIAGRITDIPDPLAWTVLLAGIALEVVGIVLMIRDK